MNESNKVKVLVVDDETGALESFKMILEIKDYEISPFLNGPDALEAAKKTPFDIAFVDIRMVPMDGIEVLKQLKVISPNTEVIIMTAYSTEEYQANAITFGAMEYLRKPFLMEEIFSLCDRALRKRREKLAGTKDKKSGPKLDQIH